jgi:hypothetical protein
MISLKHLLLTALTVSFAWAASAQDEIFIYGTVTTIDDQTYTGSIRWGKEEIYWTDMFNASKERNENLDLLSRDEIDYLKDRSTSSNDWVMRNVSWNWDNWNYDNSFVHQLAVPFGNIKSMEPISRSDVMITLQNGQEIEVDGDGYNDIGTKVRVNDNELGVIEISWSRIERVDFSATPKKLENKYGEPLYGTVKSDIGEFTGYVQWDHDERITTDKLDGDTDDGDLSIAFGKIASIEREGYSRSYVTMKSGRELELHGSNDVNSENRGIIVTVDGLGRVDIPWRDFDMVTFTDAPSAATSYGDFKNQSELTATVTTTNGDTHKGNLIFDLDESYDFEVLNGQDDDIEFEIDFKNISEITPKNYNYSKVTLKNGRSFVLGDSQDVTDDNDGVIVMKGKEPIYIPWDKVENIKF